MPRRCSRSPTSSRHIRRSWVRLSLKDKIDLTKEELRNLAQEQQIPGRSKMDHDELAATVAPS